MTSKARLRSDIVELGSLDQVFEKRAMCSTNHRNSQNLHYSCLELEPNRLFARVIGSGIPRGASHSGPHRSSPAAKPLM